MSMARCEDCDRIIDSDADPECFIETSPQTWRCVCKWCRERLGYNEDDAA